MSEKKIAVIRIRGLEGVNKYIESTLEMLRLKRKHNCVIVPATPEKMGMLSKAKDYITWGEVSDETVKLLVSKSKKKDAKVFKLNPPRGGFERKGIKKPFSIGGVLGYRADKINELIKRMV
ncbi:MAG: 50S ribosomal protein L30 [bacterium]|nr:50S ribosomal protein L30 [bacterium]